MRSPLHFCLQATCKCSWCEACCTITEQPACSGADHADTAAPSFRSFCRSLLSFPQLPLLL